MMHPTRPLFALFVMSLVAAALALATVGWFESHPERRLSADTTRCVDAADAEEPAARAASRSEIFVGR